MSELEGFSEVGNRVSRPGTYGTGLPVAGGAGEAEEPDEGVVPTLGLFVGPGVDVGEEVGLADRPGVGVAVGRVVALGVGVGVGVGLGVGVLVVFRLVGATVPPLTAGAGRTRK